MSEWITDKMKIGDKVYTLCDWNKEIIEWTIINENPTNTRFFVVVNGKGNIRQIMKSFIHYGSWEHHFPAATKQEVVNRYKKHTEYIAKELQKTLVREKYNEDKVALDLCGVSKVKRAVCTYRLPCWCKGAGNICKTGWDCPDKKVQN